MAPGGRAQGVVQGSLRSASGGAPLEFATVSVYRQADSSLVDGALTDLEGAFRLELPFGQYYMVCQFLGFQSQTLPNLALNSRQPTLNLGEITLAEDAVALAEVEVKALRSQMELKLDKRVFNVAQDLTNAGRTAADILDNVPSVTVDVDGQVSLRGSQQVRILIDGKPSGLVGLSDAEGLRRLQGDQIESIEVITNPSSRYDAEGEAGIINIVLKKDKKQGVNGSFALTAGYPDNYGASYSLNFRRRKVNFFSNFGLNYRKGPGEGSGLQETYENGALASYFTTARTHSRGSLGGNMQLGADWFLTDRQTLTASGLYRLGRGQNESELIYRDFDALGQFLGSSRRSDDEQENENNIELALGYRKTYDTPDRQLTIDFKYIDDEDLEESDYLQTSLPEGDRLVQRSSNTENERNVLFQTDYVHPLPGDARLEGGMKANLRLVDNDFLVEEQGIDGAYSPLPSFDDQLQYEENVYAAYIQGGKTKGQFSGQLGLRAEYSDITTTLLRSDAVNNRQYLNLFPSLFLSYKRSEANQFQLNFSRRISRPWFRMLLPFTGLSDPRNNRIGNPNLNPEFTMAYEAGYLRYFERGSLLSTVYYRRTEGVIEHITRQLENNNVVFFPVNLALRNAYGFEFSLSYRATEWANINANANVYRALVEGEYEGRALSSDTYTWNGRVNVRLALTKQLTFQPAFNYRAPRITTQGRELAIYHLDAGLAYDILANRGKLTLSVQDVFNTRRRRNVVDLDTFYSESDFQWRARQITLVFNYLLNPGKGGKPERKDAFEGGEGGGDF